MRQRKTRLGALAVLVTAMGLAGSIGCTSSDVTGGPGGPGGGAADIDVHTSTPASGDTNISGTGVTVASTLENGGATTRVQVDATTGGNLRQVLVYFDTASGSVSAVSYFWGASLIDNVVYCPAAGCANVTVDTVAQTISFAGTVLDNHDSPMLGDPATKFATLGFAVPASMIVYPTP